MGAVENIKEVADLVKKFNDIEPESSDSYASKQRRNARDKLPLSKNKEREGGATSGANCDREPC
jgi:hypothetical protein